MHTTNNYDFIFSNRPRYRITRHVAFWIAWWIYFLLTYLIPFNSFKGWDLSIPNAQIDKFGIVFFLKKAILVNALSGVIPHILLTYSIIYFLLPLFYSKRKNITTIVFLFIGIAAIYFCIAVLFLHIPYYHSRMVGIRTSIPNLSEVAQLAFKYNLVTVPVVVSMAITIKLIKRWWLKQKETEQLTREKANAELQLLKAQIHPHFLFNTLNNIYFFTLSASPQAPEMIKKLSGMLHYILNECNQPLVPLEKEIKMIQDYMTLEKIRYGDQMEMKIEISGDYKNKMIAPMLLIPFVENSFKHGTSKMLALSFVRLRISIEEETLHFLLINGRPGNPIPSARNGSIGLKNVKKRLELLYPGTHELTIIPEPGTFTVLMKINLEGVATIISTLELNPATAYALA